MQTSGGSYLKTLIAPIVYHAIYLHILSHKIQKYIINIIDTIPFF